MPTYNLEVKGFNIADCTKVSDEMTIAHASIKINKDGDGSIEIPATNEEVARYYGAIHIEESKNEIEDEGG